MGMNEFKSYHPVVNFIYFVFVIGFSCFFMHPVCLGISVVSGFTYSVLLKGTGAIKINLVYMIPMLLITAVMNPLFNHGGVTIIEYLPDGNPLTLESVIYGLCAAFMIVSVICHFSCYNEVMTSDKIIYLFGRIVPSLSLIISMTLRFVPRFVHQLKLIADVQRCMGRGVSGGSIIKRAKHGLDILSVMTTAALENAIETADSMKSRGYGIHGRTSFSIFRFDSRDRKALVWLFFSGIYTFIGAFNGAMDFTYFPSVKGTELSVYGFSVFFVYLLLCISPVIIELREVIRWKALRSKI